MDRTHLRFFDWATAQSLISESGYTILQSFAVGNFPQPGFRKLVPALAKRIDDVSCALLPGLFGWQFIIVAKSIDEAPKI
jgi:hypothetical protein